MHSFTVVESLIFLIVHVFHSGRGYRLAFYDMLITLYMISSVAVVGWFKYEAKQPLYERFWFEYRTRILLAIFMFNILNS